MYSKIKRRNKFLNGIPRTVQRPWLPQFHIKVKVRICLNKILKTGMASQRLRVKNPKRMNPLQKQETNKTMTPELHRNMCEVFLLNTVVCEVDAQAHLWCRSCEQSMWHTK